MTAHVSMLLKWRASPDMLPFSLCNKKRLAIRHMKGLFFPTTLSIPSSDIGKQVGLRTYLHPLVLSGFRNTTIIRYRQHGVLHSYIQGNTGKIVHNLLKAACRGVQAFTPSLAVHPFTNVILCMKQNSDTNNAYLHIRKVFISMCILPNAFIVLICKHYQ